MPTKSWIWVPITKDTVLANEASAFTLSTGSNTIGVVSGGWGEMKFAEVDVVPHGSIDTIRLKAPDAVPVLVIPGVEGNPIWIPSGFKYVNMGTAGTIKFNFFITKTIPYRFGFLYQNVNGIQPATITIDTTVYHIFLPGNADSATVSYLSPLYNINQFNNTVIVSANNINFDFILLYPGYGAVNNDNNQQLSFSLEQNYPNPFNPSTSIGFSLAKTTKIELSIYNILGQKVNTIVNGVMNAGSHVVQFNAGKLASGIYFYGIKTRKFEIYKKMMILK